MLIQEENTLVLSWILFSKSWQLVQLVVQWDHPFLWWFPFHQWLIIIPKSTTKPKHLRCYLLVAWQMLLLLWKSAHYLPCKGRASSLKLERTDGSAQSTNIAVGWLAWFWLLANSCPSRVRIMHSRWRTVILVNSPCRWLMCCSICLFLSLIYCKRPAANPKHMPRKET